MKIQKNIDLTSFNTFGLPSVAQTYAKVESVDDLRKLDLEQPLFVLGGGSNILLPTRLDKLVIHNHIDFIHSKILPDGQVEVEVGAGVNWHHLVTVCVKMGWGGIENLALIPGRVGAAPVQNIGAYGVELKDVFLRLTAFDIVSNDVVVMDKSMCDFGYRNSRFKKADKGRFIINSVSLLLKTRDHQVNMSYYAIKDLFDEMKISNPTIQQVYDAVVQVRSSKLPDPSELGNSGSFFKNPVVSSEKLKKLIIDFPNLKYYENGQDYYKIPAGYLIEQCGWKGKRVGNTGCYKKQALVIVNYGGASSEDVVALVRDIKQSVFNKFGIALQEEVNIIKSI